MNQPKNCRHKEIADPYRWNATTIGYILDRQEYLGHTVLGKSICENFKTKQRRAATPDELMIFPDTHEAIIDQDTWDIARNIRSKKKPRVANGTTPTVCPAWCTAPTAGQGWAISVPKPSTAANAMILISLFNAAIIGVRAENVFLTM